MVEFVLAVLAGLGAFFRSRADLARNSCSPSTSGCTQTETSTTGVELVGSAVLGAPVTILVEVEERPDRCPTRDRGRLAPSRIPVVLAIEISPASRASSNHQRDPRTDRQAGEREYRLGCTKIHGELLKLGFNISGRTVARYLRRLHRRGDPQRSWLTFLENHREVIVALDFFTVR
jgi:hypothetical protein